MNVEMEKEKIGIDKVVKEKTDIAMIEGDCIVPDIKPDIIESVSTSGNVCIYKKEVLDGKIRVDGCINTYIMYLSESEEEKVRGLNTNLDFTQMLDMDGCKSGMDLEMSVSLRSIECKILNGRKVSLKAQVEFRSKVFSTETAEIVKEIKNKGEIQRLNKCLEINSLVGSGSNKGYAKDTIMIDNTDNLVEILRAELTIINKDFKISYNKVLAKAECAVRLLYLTEDNRIASVEGNIPVMGFVDINGVAEENIPDMQYLLKNVIIKPNDVQEHSIYVEAEVEFSCRMYEVKKVNVIQDLYSPECDIKFNQKNISTIMGMQEVKDVCQIRESITIPEIGENQIDSIQVIPNIRSKTGMDKVVQEGEMAIRILYSVGNRVDTKEVSIPVNFEMRMSGINQNSVINTEIEIRNQNFVVMAGGTVDCKVDLEFCVKSSNTIQMNIIDDIEMEEARQDPVHSMVIYFVKAGDTLWNIAKKFRSTVEDIVRINEIEDENKIYPGQQLFIPRYVTKRRSA